VLNLERKWLATVPWQVVEATNRDLCQKDEQPHEPNPPGYETARRLWEGTAEKELKLREVLDVFRQVHKLAPFKFFNGNTVAALARSMMSGVVDQLPSVQAEMARSTVSHYVVGAIKAGELESVLGHVGGIWRRLPVRPLGAGGTPQSQPSASA
jgi:hypothetical protein